MKSYLIMAHYDNFPFHNDPPELFKVTAPSLLDAFFKLFDEQLKEERPYWLHDEVVDDELLKEELENLDGSGETWYDVWLMKDSSDELEQLYGA